MAGNRREFLVRGLGAAAATVLGACHPVRQRAGSKQSMILTVRGPIEPQELGRTLVHEHILTDFIGADRTGPHRWDREDVFAVMLPYLQALCERGVRGFADCSPAYLGRDPVLLRRLAEAAGLHILTNTGIYGAAQDKFVPAYVYRETVGQVAGRWAREFEEGIGQTGIRPGFIKIGVDPIERLEDQPPYGLSEIDAKLVRAAARVTRATGLAIASHTAQGKAGEAQVRILRDEGLTPERFIVVHADAETDPAWDVKLAKHSVWIEFDGIGGRLAAYYARRLKALLEHTDRILLSMDAGWYRAGQVRGGAVRDYNYMTDQFLPGLKAAGFSQELLDRLTVGNPARVFSVPVNSPQG